MANYNKSFNFRNGVQVDEDNFLVNSFGLVGIGTTIPRTDLDVYGNVSVSGLTTSKNLIVSGISTFSDIRVGSAITINGTLGIISAFRFLGDGSYLSNLPTSMWVDYTGPGITSIYALRNVVGIATDGPTRSLQIGGRTEIGQKGVGITSDGDIYASGIVTAGFFSGSGASITAINASNISSGTLNNSRLPSQINLATGIATIRDIVVSSGATISGINTLNSNGLTTKEVVSIGFSGNKYYVKSSVDLSSGSLLKFESGSGISINGYTGSAGDFLISNGSNQVAWTQDISISGVVTVGVLTARDIFASGITTTSTIRSQTGIITSLTSINLNSFSGDFSRVYSGLGTFVNSIATNLNVGGIGTVSTLRFTTGIGTNLSVLTFDTYSIDADEINCGVAATFVNLKSSYSTLGVTTTTSLTSSGIEVVSGITTSQKITSGNIKINHVLNTIETTSGNIIITPAGIIELNKDIIAYYQSYLTGISTVATGLLPDEALGAYLGSTLKPFEVVYVGDLNLGVGNSNKITTRSQDLVLDSATNKVNVQSDLVVDNNLNVSGISTFGTINVNTGLVPDDDEGAYLGTTSLPFSELHVGELQLAVGTGNDNNKITTASGNLILDSLTNKVNVQSDLVVDNNLNVSGISTFENTINANVGLLPDGALGAYIGSTLKPFEVVYVGDLNLGVGNSNSINTRSQNLILDSITEQVIIDNDAVINRNLSVTGGITTVTTLRTSVGIVPSTTSASLGTSLSPFSELYVENIRMGVGTTDVITTNVGELKLDSFNNIVNVQANLVVGSALSVTGQSNFSGIATVETGLLPDIDQGSYLGEENKAFSSAFIGDVKIGSGSSISIRTRTGNLELIPATQFTSVTGKLNTTQLEVSSSSLLNDVVFGSGQVAVDATNGRVGIGTSLPSTDLQLRNDAGSTNVELWSNTISQIGLGYSAIGAGRSTGNLYYNISNKELGLVNEDTGNIEFTLHNSLSSGIGTGNFVWNYGQTPETLMSLDYLGKLKIGATSNFKVPSYPATVGIASIPKSGSISTSFYVEGQTRLDGTGYQTTVNIIGKTEITGIVSVTPGTGDATGLYFDNSNGTLTINNLIVKGSTTGVTASGVGILVEGGTTSFGSNTILNFNKNLSVLAAGGMATVGVAGSIFDLDTVGIGTEIARASLDVNENNIQLPPWILPARIDTATRDSYTAIAGALIFNTSVNKHQAYDGSTWRNLY